MAEPITNVLGTVAIKHCGEYDATMHYEKLNVVTYNGSSYCAKDNTVGNLPTNTTYWDLMAEKGDTGATGPNGYTPVKGTDYYTQSDIDELEATLSSDVSLEVSDQLTDLTSATPLAVSSTSDMTDTTRIYVNTTDGHWYWYDGDSWEDGGVYQATGIENGSIDVLKMDPLLQGNYVYSYEEVTTTETNGKYMSISNDGTVLYLNDNSGWDYGIIDLEANEEYFITGKMFSANVKTYAIKNGNSLVDYTPSGTDDTFNSIIYKAKANDQLYICHRVNNVADVWVYKITDININKQKNEFTLESMGTRNGRYIDMSHRDVGSIVTGLGESASYNTTIYRLEKGKKYSFSASGYYSISGLVVTDLTNVVKYYNPRSTTAIQTTDTFIASEDGYAYICNGVGSTTVNGKISLYEETIKTKNWYAIGDSITEVNYRALHNYLYWINQDIPELNIINKGWSGTGYKNGSNTFIQRLDSINSYSLNTDIITVMGSINDIQHVASSLGELGDTTTDTLYGSMYTFFNTLFAKFNGVRVGCISPINWKGSHSSNALKLYVKALKETCELFNVPFLDMTLNTNLRPDNDTFLNTYYLADGTGNTGQVDDGGVHPNSNGHRLLYGRIKAFIQTL